MTKSRVDLADWHLVETGGAMHFWTIAIVCIMHRGHYYIIVLEYSTVQVFYQVRSDLAGHYMARVLNA